MNREAWLIFAGLAIAAALGLLGVTAWQKNMQLIEAQAQLGQVRRSAEAQAARLSEAWAEVESARTRAEALAREVAAATNSQQRLEVEMREALASRDIAVSELQGRLTVTILDRILFDTGDAALKPEGMHLLDQVARVLVRYTNRPIQVFGHTDNVPIRLRFASNWELSAARALAAVRYLTENAGVDPRRLSAVGCGEFQPIADNATAEGRARNRRIALVVLPELFAPSDVQPTNSPAMATNLPPATASPSLTNAPLQEAPADATKSEVEHPTPQL